MRVDLSRDTFQPTKHYRRVLRQQGRVVDDADVNEQTSIDIGITEQTTWDVIGQSGVPDVSLAQGDNGFGIGIAADGSDLTIAHGRIYVDGVLVENEADTTLTTQPYLSLSKNALGPSGITGDGLYGVYLDAWERVVTPIDDPEIVETALGGPDTSLRSQVAWQVKLGQIDTTEFGQNPACASILDPWGEQRTLGKIAARGGAPSTDPLPCVLPPQTGFRSLENQLYRVEIHTAGQYGTATFKWSRENGSVVAGIVSQLTGPYSSPTFRVQSVGRDSTLGFKNGDWVELVDDDAEFRNGVGQLLQVGTVDPGAMTISLQAAPTLTIDATKHPKLRRWDQTQNAGATAIPIVDGSWIDLENGVQVQFSDDWFNSGDYWLIPARTATSAQTIGSIDWPTDPSSGAPLMQLRRGVTHHFSKLAIVAYAGGTFSPPQGSAGVTDCRLFFPPLTSIQSQQGPCTIVVQPGSNWSAPLIALFAGNPSIDAEICFTVGQFPTSSPIVITTTGNVKVSGAGWGTKLIGTKIEAVLQFQGCASVSVRDLFASADTVDGPPDAKDKASKVIHGVLDFVNCGEVLVESVSLQCGGAILPGAACVAVRSDTAANIATGFGSARIRDCQFTVGETQYGVLLVHQQRAYVERNEIVPSSSKLSWAYKLKSAIFQQELAHSLINNVSFAAATAAPSSSASSQSSSSVAAAPTPRRAEMLRSNVQVLNAGVTVGSSKIEFNSPSAIKNVWQTYVDLNGPKEFANASDLHTFVRQAALSLVTDPSAREKFPSFASFLGTLERADVLTGARGIAVGGRAITELRIRDNSIVGMQQGITVGVSHREKRPPARPADSISQITIAGNAITVVLNAVRGYAKARFGILVGNASDVMIDNNQVGLSPLPRTELASDGIRVYGYLGKKMIVRHNHVGAFTRPIFVRALLPTGPQAGAKYWYTQPPQHDSSNENLWLVADNYVDHGVIDAEACQVVDNWP